MTQRKPQISSKQRAWLKHLAERSMTQRLVNSARTLFVLDHKGFVECRRVEDNPGDTVVWSITDAGREQLKDRRLLENRK